VNNLLVCSLVRELVHGANIANSQVGAGRWYKIQLQRALTGSELVWAKDYCSKLHLVLTTTVKKRNFRFYRKTIKNYSIIFKICYFLLFKCLCLSVCQCNRFIIALMPHLHQDTCVQDKQLVSGYIYVDGHMLLVRDTCWLYLGDIITVHLCHSRLVSLCIQLQTGDKLPTISLPMQETSWRQQVHKTYLRQHVSGVNAA